MFGTQDFFGELPQHLLISLRDFWLKSVPSTNIRKFVLRILKQFLLHITNRIRGALAEHASIRKVWIGSGWGQTEDVITSLMLSGNRWVHKKGLRTMLVQSSDLHPMQLTAEAGTWQVDTRYTLKVNIKASMMKVSILHITTAIGLRSVLLLLYLPYQLTDPDTFLITQVYYY